MTQRSIPVLKTYFETGDIPTETQFADLIDSLGKKEWVLATESGTTFTINAEVGKSFKVQGVESGDTVTITGFDGLEGTISIQGSSTFTSFTDLNWGSEFNWSEDEQPDLAITGSQCTIVNWIADGTSVYANWSTGYNYVEI